MKKIIFGTACALILASLFNSCTIEKRIYRDGYHISWKHKLQSPDKEVKALDLEQTEATNSQLVDEDIVPNVHSAEVLSANNTEEITFEPAKRIILQTVKDTVVPGQPKEQEEYFSNNYKTPSRPNDLQDTKLANWALGMGIGAISAPVWVILLFFLIAALIGTSWASINIWAAFALALLVGLGLYIAMEILAITFAVRFLHLHAKDPNYTKYRKRAITALILAGIYPAIIVLNIFIALAMI